MLPQTYHRKIDLLAQPFKGGEGGVVRDGETFEVTQPWSMAGFGKLSFRSGWWRFECQGEGDLSAVELRISSVEDPLVVLRPGRDSAARIYLRGTTEYDISLLVSAWPGRFVFSKLTFAMLAPTEAARLVFEAASRLATTKRPLTLMTSVIRRLASGQSIGIRTGATPASPSVAQVKPTPEAESRRRHLYARDGIEAVLEAGDLIHPQAINIVAAEFERRPHLIALYSDIEKPGVIVPQPSWDPELPRWNRCPEGPYFFRSGGRGLSTDPDARLAEMAARFGGNAVGRIPLPLIRRSYIGTPPCDPPPAPKLIQAPRVSAIIPTKYRADLLALCLDGLSRLTDYPDLEVIVVDNGATDDRFPRVLEFYSKTLRLNKIVDTTEFNFSRLINRGAEGATGDVLLLLNDDVAALQPGWLHRIVESTMRHDTGAVGAQLVYPDGAVQHAGVALGIGGVCGHLCKGMPREEAERSSYVSLPGSRTAVTGACLAVRHDIFDQVGGLDEAFAVALNDIDFCLRLQAAGYRNIYRGDARLIHHESQSRGPDDATVRKRRRMIRETRLFLERWGAQIWSDPYYSPAFDPLSERGDVHPAAWSRVPYQEI